MNQKRWEIVRDRVVEAARIGDRYQCHHCGGFFPRNEVCADHFPFTRGSRPDLKYELTNLVCSCQFCNTSGNTNRSKSFQALE